MEKYFTINFWEKFTNTFANWVITDLPSILILILLLIVVLRLSRILVSKLKDVLIKRMAYHDEQPDLEIEKRLNTLMGIVRKTVSIII